MKRPARRPLAAALLLLLLSPWSAPRAGAASDAPLAAPQRESGALPEELLAPPPPTDRPLSEDALAQLRHQRRRHLSLLAAGGVLALGGGTFGLLSRRSVDQARQAPSQPAAQARLESARNQAVVANLAFAGAALALVGSVVTFLLRPPPPTPEQEGLR